MSPSVAVRQWRYGVLVLGLALALAAVLLLTRGDSPVQATSNGSAYAVPLASAIDTNPDPNVTEVTPPGDEPDAAIGNGVPAPPQTFNGPTPAPTFTLTVGDRVIAHSQNRLDQQSGIHWHGIEL